MPARLCELCERQPRTRREMIQVLSELCENSARDTANSARGPCSARDRQRSARAGRTQRGRHLVRRSEIERHELASVVAVSDGDGHAVPVRNSRSHGGADALAAGDDAGKVQWISGTDDKDLAGRLSAPYRAQ